MKKADAVPFQADLSVAVSCEEVGQRHCPSSEGWFLLSFIILPSAWPANARNTHEAHVLIPRCLPDRVESFSQGLGITPGLAPGFDELAPRGDLGVRPSLGDLGVGTSGSDRVSRDLGVRPSFKLT